MIVDDTLVFCEASQDHITYLCWLFIWLEAISGLRINLEESELILVGRLENVNDLLVKLRCRVSSLPFSLGLPLGALFKSIGVWDGVEERSRKRLSMWK